MGPVAGATDADGRGRIDGPRRASSLNQKQRGARQRPQRGAPLALSLPRPTCRTFGLGESGPDNLRRAADALMVRRGSLKNAAPDGRSKGAAQ